jgi:hypothetical protein
VHFRRNLGVSGFDESTHLRAWSPGEPVDGSEVADRFAAGFCAQVLPQAEIDVLADETEGADGP